MGSSSFKKNTTNRSFEYKLPMHYFRKIILIARINILYQFVPTRLIFSFIYYLKLCIFFENDEWILWGKKSSENVHFSFLHRLTCFQCTTRIEFMRNLMHHIKRFTSPKWSHNMELINASKNHSIIFGERYISSIPK